VSHPAAKQMLELSRSQDEEVGDGTTSVIVLTGELLRAAIPVLERKLHPTVIVRGYAQALRVALDTCEKLAKPVDLNDIEVMNNLVMSCVGTKFSKRWGETVMNMALEATLRVARELGPATGGGVIKEVDVKRYAKVEKIPGGEISDCRVLKGVMFNKDVTHPRMRRRIEKPRILLLDCPLEYKKGESAANVQIEVEQDWNALLRLEEEYIEHVCAEIVAARPDIVITEKGVSDLAQHYLMKANITAFRRLRKTDNNRLARACGATIVSRTDEIQESDVGTQCNLFEVRKIGDEYFAFFEDCEDPKACTVLLRGGSKDVLNEIERNLQDAMQVVKNVVIEPKLLPGGGATEMAIAKALTDYAHTDVGVLQYPIAAVAKALEVIPRTLAKNCGAKTVRVLAQLKAKHLESGTWGINGETGDIIDMANPPAGTDPIWDPLAVKIQMIKTAIEASSLILRIDDIVSGISKSKT